MIDLNRLYNMDCMVLMREIPDKFFELAIVDPPYGDGGGGQWNGKDRSRFGGRFAKYHIEQSTMRSGEDSQSITDGRNMGGKILERGFL